MNTIDVEQAAFVLTRKFPQLERYVDWHTAHPLEQDAAGGWRQCGPAWIPEWRSTDIPMPTSNDLLAWWPQYKQEYECQEEARVVRQRRDDLLAQADAMIYRAEDDGDSDVIKKLRMYRKALRDIPEQLDFPLVVKWPDLPKGASE